MSKILYSKEVIFKKKIGHHNWKAIIMAIQEKREVLPGISDWEITRYHCVYYCDGFHIPIPYSKISEELIALAKEYHEWEGLEE